MFYPYEIDTEKIFKKIKQQQQPDTTHLVVLLQYVNSLGDLAEDLIHWQLRVNLGKARSKCVRI